ncbi:MAG: flagellin FliC [Erysipelotrichia bacterium]|nr:flagellin FliC [Erysipelotrichia bacterium]
MVGITKTGVVHTNLLKADEARAKSIEKLSSGKRINQASDDPAGLSATMALESQTRGLIQQIGNSQDDISLLQTAEGALDSSGQVLQRINELAVQASNGTLTDSDRQNIQFEVDQLVAQIDQTAASATYNGRQILDGSLELNMQTGETFSQPAATSAALGVSGLSVATGADASRAISLSGGAIANVASQRAGIGAAVNASASHVTSLQNELVNVTAAQTRIEDVDVAAEMINLSISSLQSKFAIKAFKIQDETRQAVLNLLSD